MLYTKSVKEISYQDVLDFCNSGHEEGFILEYKKDFPNNEIIAKTIAAFANTFGGLLIIGVNAPAGKPIPPFEGITFDPLQKYEEKIENIVLSHIREPIFPEVRVCDPVNGKTFIVVRVEESHLTPHRVSKNTRTYVRTGQNSTPSEEATWDKIEWLATRRTKSDGLREILINESERYFCDACKLRGIDVSDKSHYFAVLSLRAIPLFPQNPLIPYKDMASIENDIRIPGNRPFPVRFYNPDLIQNGVRKLSFSSGEKPTHGVAFEYTHLNTFGLYLWKGDIGELEKKEIKEQDGATSSIMIRRLDFYRILYALYEFLSSSALFYKKLGYWGSIQVVVELKNGLGVRIEHPLRSTMFGVSEDLEIPSDDLKWEKVVSSIFLQDRKRELTVEMLDAIGWSLNIRHLNEEHIRKGLDANFGIEK